MNLRYTGYKSKSYPLFLDRHLSSGIFFGFVDVFEEKRFENNFLVQIFLKHFHVFREIMFDLKRKNYSLNVFLGFSVYSQKFGWQRVFLNIVFYKPLFKLTLCEKY